MQEQNYGIRGWAKDDRPREKLRFKGSEALSDSELIAILLNNGTKEKSAVELARDVLAQAGNRLQELGRMSINDLMKIRGIGEAKAVSLIAALELGRRRQSLDWEARPQITDSRAVASFLKTRLQDRMQEFFAVLYLNQGNRIMHFEEISKGGITGTVADPRVILKKALENNAVNLILCHNHPSGNLQPSQADRDLTHKIREAARYFDIRILDHLIVSEAGWYSFADEGML